MARRSVSVFMVGIDDAGPGGYGVLVAVPLFREVVVVAKGVVNCVS